MKKIAAFIIGTFLSINSFAETIIINHSNKASPATVFAQSFSSALEKNLEDVTFYQAQNCKEASAKFKNTKNAIMVYNADVGIAAMSKNLNCKVDDITPENVIYIGQSYFKICRAKDQSKRINDPRITFGMASVVLSKGIIKDYNSNGLNLVGIPFGGSKGVLAAVISKDIDFGFIGSSVAQPAIDNDSIVCEFSTDPNDTNFVGNTFKLKISDFKLASMIYSNNTDVSNIVVMREILKSNQEFQSFLNKNSIRSKTQNFDQTDIDNFDQWIKYNFSLYWK